MDEGREGETLVFLSIHSSTRRPFLSTFLPLPRCLLVVSSVHGLALLVPPSPLINYNYETCDVDRRSRTKTCTHVLTYVVLDVEADGACRHYCFASVHNPRFVSKIFAHCESVEFFDKTHFVYLHDELKIKRKKTLIFN